MTDLMAIACDVLGDFVARVKRGFPVQLAAAMMDRDFNREIKRPIEMDWLGWAVPAILTELDEHRHRRDRYCRCRGYFETHAEWADHVAPLIAKRIGCDPKRAAQALSRYIPDRV